MVLTRKGNNTAQRGKKPPAKAVAPKKAQTEGAQAKEENKKRADENAKNAEKKIRNENNAVATNENEPWPTWITAQDALLLAGADTVHDMKQTRIPESFPTVCPIVHNKGLVPAKDLDGKIMGLNPYMVNPDERDHEPCYKNWLSGTMNRKITPSNVENDTVAYFERKYPELGDNHVLVKDTDLQLTSQDESDIDIIKIMEDITKNKTIVEINFTDEIPANEFDSFKSRLGLFILHFLYGDYNPFKDYFLCFDANVPRLEKLFVSQDNVYNCITPQKIADSSSVLNNLKGKRKVYKFPVDTIPTSTNIRVIF